MVQRLHLIVHQRAPLEWQLLLYCGGAALLYYHAPAGVPCLYLQ